MCDGPFQWLSDGKFRSLRFYRDPIRLLRSLGMTAYGLLQNPTGSHGFKGIFFNPFADLDHHLIHKIDVVQGDERGCDELIGFDQVMQVST